MISIYYSDIQYFIEYYLIPGIMDFFIVVGHATACGVEMNSRPGTLKMHLPNIPQSLPGPSITITCWIQPNSPEMVKGRGEVQEEDPQSLLVRKTRKETISFACIVKDLALRQSRNKEDRGGELQDQKRRCRKTGW